MTNKEEREEVLALFDRYVGPLDNQQICSTPTDREIEQVVFGFKLNTSPGLDGVSADVAGGCWDFVSAVCYAAVREFWKHNIMA
jgi:hypothetical protein